MGKIRTLSVLIFPKPLRAQRALRGVKLFDTRILRDMRIRAGILALVILSSGSALYGQPCIKFIATASCAVAKGLTVPVDRQLSKPLQPPLVSKIRPSSQAPAPIDCAMLKPAPPARDNMPVIAPSKDVNFAARVIEVPSCRK